MANTNGMCTSFKAELMSGRHALGTPPARTDVGGGLGAKDTVKAVLITTGQNCGPSITNYSGVTAMEVAETGDYTAGGKVVTNANEPATGNSKGYWTPSAAVTFTGVTVDTDCALLINSSQGNRAIASCVFGRVNIFGGTFALNAPANTDSAALLRIA